MLKLFYMSEAKYKQKVQIIVTASNSILLLKLNEERGGFWQNATGSVELDEAFIQAAKRELQEETGIINDLKELPMTFSFLDRWGFQVTEKVFHCELQAKPTIILSEEHQSYKWLPIIKLCTSDYEFMTHYQAAMLTKENN